MRVGVVASRAVGNAVVRNRTKRRLRALLAERLPGLPEGLDLVVRANPPAATAATRELRLALDQALPRAVSAAVNRGSSRPADGVPNEASDGAVAAR